MSLVKTRPAPRPAQGPAAAMFTTAAAVLLDAYGVDPAANTGLAVSAGLAASKAYKDATGREPSRALRTFNGHVGTECLYRFDEVDLIADAIEKAVRRYAESGRIATRDGQDFTLDGR